MPRRRLGGGWLLALGLLVLVAGCRAQPPGPLSPLELSWLAPSGAIGQAGLRVGDRVISFRRGTLPGDRTPPAAGPLSSCLDWARVEMEESPLGPVHLVYERAGRRAEVELPAGDWYAVVAPSSAGSTLERFCAAFAEARKAAYQGHPDLALERFEGVLALAGQGLDPLARVLVAETQGGEALKAAEIPRAEENFREQLRLARALQPEGLIAARAWHWLGLAAQNRGDAKASAAAFEEARRLREKLAPHSLELASTRNYLGIDAWMSGDFQAARVHMRTALELMEARDKRAPELPAVTNNLGLLARELGDYAAADRYFRAALALYQERDPNGEPALRVLVNLGLVAQDRGELAQAERLEQDALKRFEALEPQSLAVAQILENLGIIARERAQYADAERLMRRGLALRHQLAPGSKWEIRSLSALAWVSYRQGRFEEAEGLGRRVLELARSAGPESQEVASTLHTLAELSLRRGRAPEAVAFARQAVAIKRKLSPGGLRLAIGLKTLGDALGELGQFAEAEAVLEEARGLYTRLAPDSYQEASAWASLGALYARSKRAEKAEQAYLRAIVALEQQLTRLGGSDDDRAAFQTEYSDIYKRLIALQLARGDRRSALETLERSRGRALLAELSRRDLLSTSELPPELAAERRRLGHAYETVQWQLAPLDSTGGERREELLARLAELRAERASLLERIAQASPRYAALRLPALPKLAAIRAALEPGTLFLSYSVAEQECWLFVVYPAKDPEAPAEGLLALSLATDPARLAQEVALLRSLILRGQETPELEPALIVQAQRLYRLLLAPAASALARADRLLISPDGPLLTLPFAALATSTSPPRFLVEQWPILTVLSAAIYSELAASGPPARDSAVVFAAPTAGPESSPPATAEGSSAVGRYEAGLPELPGAREEAEALVLTWKESLAAYSGAQATESRAKALAGRPSFVHFACHALLDPNSPLDSGLALARPARPDEHDDGLLQAWEIFEQLHFSADLVTLSSCETALGRDTSGEGLIGLTRAFQHAGARAVLASLWPVSDRSTADLMARFYRRLAAGERKAAALAHAQRELIEAGGAFAHPYHWAGFVLSGADP